jgi:hypothetical protein
MVRIAWQVYWHDLNIPRNIQNHVHTPVVPQLWAWMNGLRRLD